MHREAIFIEHARTRRAYGEIKNCLHSSMIAWRLAGDLARSTPFGIAED